jgi:hypothetical protein
MNWFRQRPPARWRILRAWLSMQTRLQDLERRVAELERRARTSVRAGYADAQIVQRLWDDCADDKVR